MWGAAPHPAKGLPRRKPFGFPWRRGFAPWSPAVGCFARPEVVGGVIVWGLRGRVGRHGFDWQAVDIGELDWVICRTPYVPESRNGEAMIAGF